MNDRYSFYALSYDQRADRLAKILNGMPVEQPVDTLGGDIYFIDQGSAIPRWVVAKTPRASRAIKDPSGAARDFIHEFKFQERLYFNLFVHWPHRFGIVDDAPYALFRRWNGDLSEWIKRDDFCDAGRIALLINLSRGLRHCHSRGLDAHQDLKPENIFVRDRRSEAAGNPAAVARILPMVADFGSANLARELRMYSGTAVYMAPEQWAELELTEKTSVWSLGAIGYELMSRGIHPSGEAVRHWDQHRRPFTNRANDRSRWKRLSGAFVPAPLDDGSLNKTLRSCLEVKPENRPSLAEFESALSKTLAEAAPEAYEQVKMVLNVASDTVAPEGDWEALRSNFDDMVAAAVKRLGPDVQAPLQLRGR